MTNTLDYWKERQYKKYITNIDFEYIYETKSVFVIVFDEKMNALNYEIYKEDIKSRQCIMSIIIDISNNYKIHKRINKTIYEELLDKLNRYIGKSNYLTA